MVREVKIYLVLQHKLDFLAVLYTQMYKVMQMNITSSIFKKLVTLSGVC